MTNQKSSHHVGSSHLLRSSWDNCPTIYVELLVAEGDLWAPHRATLPGPAALTRLLSLPSRSASWLLLATSETPALDMVPPRGKLFPAVPSLIKVSSELSPAQ